MMLGLVLIRSFRIVGCNELFIEEVNCLVFGLIKY